MVNIFFFFCKYIWIGVFSWWHSFFQVRSLNIDKNPDCANPSHLCSRVAYVSFSHVMHYLKDKVHFCLYWYFSINILMHLVCYCVYRMNPKYWDLKFLLFYHTCSKNWTTSFCHLLICLKTAGWVANSVDPDQTPRNAASDLGLHCLLEPVCSNTQGNYDIFITRVASCIQGPRNLNKRAETRIIQHIPIV